MFPFIDLECDFCPNDKLAGVGVCTIRKVRIDFRIGTFILRHSKEVAGGSRNLEATDKLGLLHPGFRQIIANCQILQAQEGGVLQQVRIEDS